MKKFFLSAAISFALNVVYTGVLFTLHYYDIHRLKKDTWMWIPFKLSSWLIEIVYPQIKDPVKPNVKVLLFGLFVLYLLNTIIYALPIYGIWLFISRNKKPKPVLSEEPPPPPVF